MQWYPELKEEKLKIPVANGKEMHAILRGSWKMPIVILLHGRPSSGNSVTYYLAARYFEQKGFATLRIFLYGESLDERDLIDHTIDTYVADYEKAIDLAKSNGSEEIFAVGHSYGGLVVLKSNAKIKAISLWDPAHGTFFSNRESFEIYPEFKVPNKPIIVGTSGPGYIESSTAQVEEETWGDNSSWAIKDYPVQFINSDVEWFQDSVKRYYADAKNPKDLLHIKGADHLFVASDAILKELFDSTINWFNKHK